MRAPLKVTLIGVFPFEASGGGPCGRLRNFALALKSAGAEPSLLLVSAELTVRFEWQGIPVNGFARANSPGSRWFGGRVNAAAVDAMGAEIGRRQATGEVDCVLFYNQDIIYAWRIARLCARLGLPFIQQYAEKHLPQDYASGWRNTYFLSESLHLQIIPRISSGSVVISRELLVQVGRRAKHEPLLLPTVCPLWSLRERTLSSDPMLVCISNGARRDDLPVLLRAMARVRAAGSCWRVRIIGLPESAKRKISALATQLGLGKRARFDGFLPEAEFNAAVKCADAFVLLRSDDSSSRACFPSRLADLFATGAPVILTAVGDLPHYFVDRRDCLLTPPGDEIALAEGLIWLERNSEAGRKLGRQGSIQAMRAFDLRRSGLLLAEYLAALRCNLARSPEYVARMAGLQESRHGEGVGIRGKNT